MPEVPGHRVTFYSSPREQGGGDLLDLHQASSGVYFFTIGDVMGKGLQAKFYAFSFLSYVRGTLHAMLAPETSPADILSRLNEVLMQDEVMADTFASLLLLKWDVERHTVTFANAGHPRPIMAKQFGSHVLESSDLILGLDASAQFHDETTHFDEGDALVAYTDGIMEQRLKSGEMVGEAGVLRAATSSRTSARPIETMLSNILDESEEDDFTDDVLVFWLQREG